MINKQSFASGLLGGVLSLALFSGTLFATTNIADLLQAGSAFSYTSNADNDTTKVAVNGSVLFKTIDNGPGFGSGIGGMAYRNTGETNMDPSFVQRFVTYTRECYDPGTGGIPWCEVLTKTGLCVGCLVGDTGTFPAYPQFKLDVRGDMRQAGAGDTFFRIGSQSSSTSVNVGYLFERAGNPVWAMGMLPGMCGTGVNNNDIVLCKLSGGTWVKVASWPY